MRIAEQDARFVLNYLLQNITKIHSLEEVTNLRVAAVKERASTRNVGENTVWSNIVRTFLKERSVEVFDKMAFECLWPGGSRNVDQFIEELATP